MRIIVDQLPESPRACLFSQHNCEYGYLCTLRPLRPLITDSVPEHRRKPIIRCRDVDKCEFLVELSVASIKTEDPLIDWEDE